MISDSTTVGIRFIARVSALVFVVLIVHASASFVYAQATPSGITRESIIRYLEKDLFILPGVGFRQVHLGLDFSRVEKNWGKPNTTGRPSLSARQWIYHLGSTTQIAVRGSKHVDEIEVRGAFNSPIETSDGVRFGMSPHQVISLYGRPTQGDLRRMRYPARGIELGFNNALLFSVTIFKKTN